MAVTDECIHVNITGKSLAAVCNLQSAFQCNPSSVLITLKLPGPAAGVSGSRTVTIA